MGPENKNIEDRTVYFDYLRVFATFSVIILHLSAQNWFTTDVNGFEWQVFNFYDSIVRWGVPVFVMISGALFLDREIATKTIYSRYVLRLLSSFVIWSAAYAVFRGGGEKVDKILIGHYHLWFLPMIIGLYICIPFIKPIIQSDLKGRYYLILTFLFAFLIPQTVTLINDFGSDLLIQRMGAFKTSVNNMNMHIVEGYAGYFVLGYYLNKIQLSKRQRITIYLLGAAGFTLTIFLDLVVALRTQQCCSHYYGNFNINVLFESVAVFTWFRYKEFYCAKWNTVIQKLSQYSFGAYLVHVFVIDELNIRLGINTLTFNPMLAVIFIGIVVFIISFGISAILNQIPVARRYMV